MKPAMEDQYQELVEELQAKIKFLESKKRVNAIKAAALEDFAFQIGPIAYFRCTSESDAVVKTRFLLRSEADRLRLIDTE